MYQQQFNEQFTAATRQFADTAARISRVQTGLLAAGHRSVTAADIAVGYALMLAGATASGLQPVLFSTWPAWADVFMSAAVCLWLGLSSRRVHTPDYDGPQRRLEDA